MKQALINWMKENGGKHLEALVIAAVLIFGGRMWLRDHDARLRLDTDVQAKQATIDSLQKQQAAVIKTADTKVSALQKLAATVKTAPEAITKLPELELPAFPLHVETIPDAPERASVEAVPLYQTLNTCAQCAVKLDATERALDLQKAIDKEKDGQISDLKKKPRFWKHLGKAALVTGCSGAGAAAGSLAGTKGAAIGGTVGAGLCQMF